MNLVKIINFHIYIKFNELNQLIIKYIDNIKR